MSQDRVVPVEPTFEQWQAGSLCLKAHNDTPHMESPVRKDVAIAVYKAMLSACPEPAAEAVAWTHFDIAYDKAVQSSKPEDWMEAALCAQQIRGEHVHLTTHHRDAAGKETVAQLVCTCEAPFGEHSVSCPYHKPVDTGKYMTDLQEGGDNSEQSVEQYHPVDATESAGTLPCGHPASLLVKSVESDYQFCDLCECRKLRNDATQMASEQQIRAEAAEHRLSQRPDQQELVGKIEHALSEPSKEAWYCPVDKKYCLSGGCSKGHCSRYDQPLYQRIILIEQLLRAAAAALSKEGE